MSSALLGLRRRWLLIVTLAAAAAGAVAAYSFTAAKHYEATALLVVSPVSASDPTFLGIDVFRESQRRTAAETAAHLIRSPQIADTVRVRLGLRRSSADLLDDLSARVAGRSDAVDVTATDTAPARAAQLANAFVDAFVASRTSAFQSEVVSAVARLQRRLVAMSPNERVGPGGAQLQRRLADTRALVSMRDPTVSAGSQAVQPRSASWPKPVRWTIYAALAGFAAGCLIALGLGLAGALRRRGPAGAVERDPEAAERLAARLEQRLSDRVDALVEEQTRLSGREAGLEVREREISAKLEELRAAAERPAAPIPPAVEPERLEQVERREQALAGRVKTIEQRERELSRRAAELSRRETDLGEERAAVEKRGEELDAREEALGSTETERGTRQTELGARERELESRAAELGARERGLESRAAELGTRERELESRAAELGTRERGLESRAVELGARERGLESRAAELGAREEELNARESDLADRDAKLASRESELASSEEALASRGDDLRRAEARLSQDRAAAVAREEELAARASEGAAPPPAVAPPSGPVAGPWLPTELAPPPPAYGRGWRLEELERLVERESASRPERADEWRSYLFYLREYADSDGRVPSRFDWLIEDAFGELLARR